MDIKSLNIKFDFATELTYEELTGKAFEPRALVDDEGKITTRELVNLTTAVIIAANPGIEDATAFMHENNRQEVIDLFNLVGKALHDWLIVPPMAESHIPESSSDQDNEEEKGKNA